MAEPLNLPDSVVAEFSSRNPSQRDIEQVLKLLKNLARNPNIGMSIPFDVHDYADCFVTWTSDNKWRVVFRRRNPGGVDVLSIALEDS